jgi:hypothetical protein
MRSFANLSLVAIGVGFVACGGRSGGSDDAPRAAGPGAGRVSGTLFAQPVELLYASYEPMRKVADDKALVNMDNQVRITFGPTAASVACGAVDVSGPLLEIVSPKAAARYQIPEVGNKSCHVHLEQIDYTDKGVKAHIGSASGVLDLRLAANDVLEGDVHVTAQSYEAGATELSGSFSATPCPLTAARTESAVLDCPLASGGE